MNDGKNKNRQKKNGLLRGIGHMFRFGKHRKDGIAPISDNVPADYTAGWSDGPSGASGSTQQKTQTLTVKNVSSKAAQPSSGSGSVLNGPTTSSSSSGGGISGAINPATTVTTNGQRTTNSIERSASSGVVVNHPPLYQPPPPPPQQNGSNMPTSIHHTDVFNHRYSHYVNYEELQQQIR